MKARIFAARSGWWLLPACFAWLGATAWLRPLTAPDEGRYAGVALWMLHSGDWLVPRLDGLAFFHKPPLFYWIGAAAMALAGPVEWAARVPSLLGAMLGAGTLYAFVRRWGTPLQARWSLAVLASMPFFYVGAQFANLDMLVAGCISATLLLGAWAALARERGGPWRGVLAGAFAAGAAGLLAKGLIGLVLPGAVFVLWCGATRRFARLRVALWLPGWGLLLLLAGPWFVAMQLRFSAFFDYFVIEQHFRRFAATGFNNVHPAWFYLPVIAGLALPWSLWALGALGGVRALGAPEVRSALGAPGRRPGLRGGAARLGDVDWLMVAWLATIVLFFSLPRSKLIGYVLPALPPLAFLLVRAMVRDDGGGGGLRRGVRATAWAACAVCVGSVVAVAHFGTPPGARLVLPPGVQPGPDARVMMLGSYYYEIPFYWQLRQPVLIADDWRSGDIARHDNWRKEIADAARFDPERAARTLVGPERMAAVLCVPQATWLVAPADAAQRYPWIAKARLVAWNESAAVLRFDGSATGDAHCLDLPAAAGEPASR